MKKGWAIVNINLSHFPAYPFDNVTKEVDNRTQFSQESFHPMSIFQMMILRRYTYLKNIVLIK